MTWLLDRIFPDRVDLPSRRRGLRYLIRKAFGRPSRCDLCTAKSCEACVYDIKRQLP